MSIAAIAGAALLLGATSSMNTTSETLKQVIAEGLAQQMLDEAVGCRYMEYGASAYDTSLQPGSDEQAAGTRELYDDIDDFNGVRQQPPKDRWNIPIGTEDIDRRQRDPNFRVPAGYFNCYRQEVDVYYVDPADLTVRLAAGQVSDYRAVEVRIAFVDPVRGARTLTTFRRVVAYVPPIQ